MRRINEIISNTLLEIDYRGGRPVGIWCSHPRELPTAAIFKAIDGRPDKEICPGNVKPGRVHTRSRPIRADRYLTRHRIMQLFASVV